jgi:hypothetical protein
MISFLKESQAKIVQCEVDRSNAERDADLSRGQRELAEQKAEQAEASRLAVERENQALSQDLSKLKELVKQAAERGQLRLGTSPEDSQGTQGRGSSEVLRSLSTPELLTLARLEASSTKPLKVGVLAIFGKLKSRITFNPQNKVLSAVAHFSGFKPNLAFINHWNSQHRFGRVYLDKDQDFTLEAELDLEPGVRQEALRAWMKGYGILLNIFHQDLVAHERGKRGKGRKRSKKRGSKGALSL